MGSISRRPFDGRRRQYTQQVANGVTEMVGNLERMVFGYAKGGVDS